MPHGCPFLHRCETTVQVWFGAWEPAQRYWRGHATELDVVARSVNGNGFLIGEAKWSCKPGVRGDAASRISVRSDVARATALRSELSVGRNLELCEVLFVLESRIDDAGSGGHVVDARAVMSVLV